MTRLPSSVAVAVPAPPETCWFGHPPRLTVLFLTETWEKFSYYGMRALLVYYMVTSLGLPQAQASLIYGAYTATAYLTPIFGGYLADRWLGPHRAVVIGGSLMALGHLMLTREPLFYPALATIVIGNGLYLPSLPGQIRALYAADDPRRTGAYTVYYVGVNIGGFLSPLICGTLGELYGWHWGFGAAGIGMLLGLAIYVAGSRSALTAPPAATAAPSARESGARAVDRRHRGTIVMLALVALIVVIFRAAYEQQGNTLALWAQGVERSVGAWTIPMTWFQSLNPLLVFLISPLLVASWTRRAARYGDVPPLKRMALGAALVAASFVLLAAADALGLQHAAGLGLMTLVAFFVLNTVGELYILPVGLSLFGRLAPHGLESTMIALWFLASFGGNLAAGALGMLWSSVSHAQFFALTACVSLAAGLALAAMNAGARGKLDG